MTKDIQVSLKNTKEQILAAYNEALELVKKKQVTPEQEKVIISKTNQVKEVEEYGYNKLSTQLGQLRSDFLKSLDVFNESVADEYDRFIKLQEAIKIEQQHLSDLYSINEQADTLSTILLANQKARDEFNAQMKEDQEKWDNQLLELELDYKSKRSELEKQRKREDEEYTYNLMQKRKQETDKYEREKQDLLHELDKQKQAAILREEAIAKNEQEFIQLQSRVANIEQEVQEKVSIAEAKVTTALQQEFKFTQALKDEQAKRTTELLEQKIESLQQKIKEQDELLTNINSRLQAAQEQSQKIAHKALETSIQRNVIISPTDSNQAKS
jgi:hypothetical protein